MKHAGWLIAAVAAWFALNHVCVAEEPTAPANRKFELRYTATIEGLAPGSEYRVWIPIPPSNEDQDVTILNREVPSASRTTREAKYNNELLFAGGKAAANQPVTLDMTYQIKRKELRGEQPAKGDAAAFLKPDARVPVGGKSLSLLRNKELPADQLQLAHVLYDTVFDHMRYSKDGTGWGLGDADWACDSRFGNCSDFHSLFISMARGNNIPAKFEIGYGLPAKRGEGTIAGYHCWAKFRPNGKGWFGVDISEASKDPKMRDYYFGNLTADRVTFTTGRDLMLEPRQDGPAVNFLIAPYVEVGAKPYPADKVKLKVSYRDLN